jgi:hypothetical protein
MLANKIFTFLLPLFFIPTLSSCEKRPVQAVPIDALIKPVDILEEVKDDITIENQPLISKPNEELVELDSLNMKALDLSSENDELEKKIRALSQELNELKKTILDKINKTKELP